LNKPRKENTMSTFHAVVWMDHQSAQVLQFDEEHVQAQRVKAHTHHTRQHGTDARHEREFYDQITNALVGVQEVLLVGPGQARDDFRKHVVQHHAELAKHVVDSVPADHPSEHQLVALARKYFAKYDLMSGTPTPTGI
jgi:stalled ribosome rescue protein Dom34